MRKAWKIIFAGSFVLAILGCIGWFCPVSIEGRYVMRGMTISGVSTYRFQNGKIDGLDTTGAELLRLGSYVHDNGETKAVFDEKAAGSTFAIKAYIFRLAAYDSARGDFVTVGYRAW